MAPSLAKPVVRALLLLGYVGLSTAVLVEIGLRWFLPQPLPQPAPDIYRPDPQIGWRRSPNAHVIANTGERDVEICTDARGDRVSCGPSPHGGSGCSARILVLGDSFVEALAIPYEETVWSRIERHTGACVHVGGVGGYWPQQYARQASERLRDPNQPLDLVILNFYPGNDFTSRADAMPSPEEVSLPRIHPLPTGCTRQDLWDWLYPYNEWLEAHSHLYVAGRFALRESMGYDDLERYGVMPALRRSALSEALVSETLRVLARLGEEAQAGGVPVLVVVLPIRNQVLDPHAEALRSRFPTLADDLDMNLVAQRFVPRLLQVAGVNRVVDLLPYFRDHADVDAWGRRDLHFSARGHELWFDAIRGSVDEILAESS